VVYSNKTKTFLHSGVIRYHDPNNLTLPSENTTMHFLNFTQKNYKCHNFDYIAELKLGVFACRAVDNRWFILTKCADDSCNDQTEMLRISENRRDKISELRVKKMPAYSSNGFTLFAWFPGDVLLEIVSFNDRGKFNSEIKVFERKINQIYYFAGQLVVIEFKNPNGEVEYFYLIHDFGTNFQFSKMRKMYSSGRFINSYNSKDLGYLMIEIYDDNFNILSMHFDRETNQFSIQISMDADLDNTMTKETKTYIFELGDYKLIASASPIQEKDQQLTWKNIQYTMAYKGKILPLTLKPELVFFHSKFSKISGLDQLVAILYNKTDVDSSVMKRVKFLKPQVKIKAAEFPKIKELRILEEEIGLGEADKTKESAFYKDKDTEGVMAKSKFYVSNGTLGDSKTALYLEYDILVSRQNLGSLWWIEKKLIDDGKGNKTFEAISGTLSGMILKLHKLVRGSFLVVKKMKVNKKELSLREKVKLERCKNQINRKRYGKDEDMNKKYVMLEIEECEEKVGIYINFKNRINPLLTYTEVKGSKSKMTALMKSSGFSMIVNRGEEIEQSAVYCFDHQNSNISRFDVNRNQLTKTKSLNERADGKKYEIFNESVYIVQGEKNLWFVDVNNEGEKIMKEVMFEKGQCSEFMMVKHSRLDTTFWCRSKKKVEAYFARELLAGKVGLSKVPVTFDKYMDFEGLMFEYTEMYQDYFYCMNKQFELLIFKIDANNYIKVTLVQTLDLKMQGKENLDTLLDFKFIEDKLVVYSDEKVGWDSRIVFHVYHFPTAVEASYLRSIVLDYQFAPDHQDLQLYRFQSIRTNPYKDKYYFMPMLAVKIKYNLKYDNVLFINPHLEYLQTIPSAMFSIGSQITAKIGCAMTTDFKAFSTSLVVVYHPYGKPELAKLAKIYAEELKLRLYEARSTDAIDLYTDKESLKAEAIHFDLFNSTDFLTKNRGVVLKIDFKKSDDSNKKLVVFNKSTSVLDLKSYKYSNSLIQHKRIVYKIDTFGMIKGSVFRFGLTAESQLEIVSKVIQFKPHVYLTDKNHPKNEQFGFDHMSSNRSCTKYFEIIAHSMMGDKKEYATWRYWDSHDFILKKNGLLVERYHLRVCKGRLGPELRIRAISMNMTLHEKIFKRLLKNLYISDYNLLFLEYKDNILNIISKERGSNRITHIDLYFLDLHQTLNKTLTRKLKISNKVANRTDLKSEDEKKAEQAREDIEDRCYHEHMMDENEKQRIQRIRECRFIKSAFLLYQTNIEFIKRKNFRLDQHDYKMFSGFEEAEIPSEKNESVKVKKKVLRIDYATFGIKKNIYAEYVIEMIVDKILVDYNLKDPSRSRKFVSKKDKMINFKIDRKFSKERDFRIYDDISYKMIKRQNESIWILMENPSASNYILRYPKTVINETKTQNQKGTGIKGINSKQLPDVWKLENPYFSKHSGARVESKFQDWLMVIPKVNSDSTHFLIYIVPHEKIVDDKKTEEQRQSYKKPIFTKAVMILGNVTDYKIKRFDFMPFFSKIFSVILKIVIN
jgi:hypothetical protein